MVDGVEECWLADERRTCGAAEAPLLCRRCKRLEKLRRFSLDQINREEQLFINGFRLALAEIAIQLDHLYPLSLEEKEYIQCLEFQTKCSIDRGIPVTTLEETINEIFDRARANLGKN